MPLVTGVAQAGIAFGADHLEVRMTLEDAAEHEEPDDVLHAADDVHEAVDAVAARALRDVVWTAWEQGA